MEENIIKSLDHGNGHICLLQCCNRHSPPKNKAADWPILFQIPYFTFELQSMEKTCIINDMQGSALKAKLSVGCSKLLRETFVLDLYHQGQPHEQITVHTHIMEKNRLFSWPSLARYIFMCTAFKNTLH